MLGVVTLGITLIFEAALARIPLGTASALNFIGPLGLAALVGHPRRFRWPALAALGVLLLTQPWHGRSICSACFTRFGAGGLWAVYIVMTQRIGDEVTGLGIAVLCPILPYLLEFAALRLLTTAVFGTLMAVEPAFAMVVGLALLHQLPDLGDVFGICLVIVAGIRAARTGARTQRVNAPGEQTQ